VRRSGVGADTLVDSDAADPPTLFDRELNRPRRIELAMDQIRARLGDQSVQFGCGLPTAGNTSHPTTIRRKEGR
jgi:hypothetical protein